MKGIAPHSLTKPLTHVQPENQTRPIQSFVSKEKLDEIKDSYHRLPLESLSQLSFDQLCKLYFSSTITLHSTVEKKFETDIHLDVIRKIISSIWRWSRSRGTWNEIVDAYDRIRNFSFETNPDFNIRLDYSKGRNQSGYSKFSETFLDGSFGFLVHYRNKHVMTVGFSILNEKRILIQQVQLTQRSGNRFLYQLPNNRLEFIIDLFRKNFPDYLLHIINAKDLTKKIASEYKSSLERWHDSPERSAQIKEAIRHLRADEKRLVSFYKNTGRYRLKKKTRVTANGLSHFQIEI